MRILRWMCSIISDYHLKQLARLRSALIIITLFVDHFVFLQIFVIVRKDLEVVKHTSYNSTQEMFLTQVGIQNSFSEDQEGCQVPFFVSQ